MEPDHEDASTQPSNAETPSGNQDMTLPEESGPKAESRWEGYSLATLSIYFDNC